MPLDPESVGLGTDKAGDVARVMFEGESCASYTEQFRLHSILFYCDQKLYC